jgi:uncharacterized protein YegJ (DUF2314 family)
MRCKQRCRGPRALAILCLLLTSACSHEPQSPPAAPAAEVHLQLEDAVGAGELIQPGDLMKQRISLQYAVYYLPKPTKDPLAEIDRLLKDQFQALRRVEKIDDTAHGRVLAVRIETDLKNAYSPPDMDSLKYFGRGISREEATALQATEQAVILDFAHAKADVWKGLREATELSSLLAKSTGGLLWDEATREVFSSDVWHQRRIADWTEEIPEVSKHTVIHAYQKDEYVRAITLGMEKFGLPDVVVENFSWSTQREMGNLLNLFAQTIAEGAVAQKAGEFDLEIKTIKNAKVRDAQLASLKPKATGVALLSLKKGKWEEGDPSNRLIELAFDRGAGPDVHARQEQVLVEAFGSEDQISLVKHDEEIRAASKRARAKLPGLRKAFEKGLEPGEFIQLKAPFERPDEGHEWMWVEVTSWQDDKIAGLLKNEPYAIPTLHAGQVVEISEADVFDYIHKFPDGSHEGNETGKLIAKQAK